MLPLMLLWLHPHLPQRQVFVAPMQPWRRQTSERVVKETQSNSLITAWILLVDQDPCCFQIEFSGAERTFFKCFACHCMRRCSSGCCGCCSANRPKAFSSINFVPKFRRTVQVRTISDIYYIYNIYLLYKALPV